MNRLLMRSLRGIGRPAAGEGAEPAAAPDPVAATLDAQAALTEIVQLAQQIHVKSSLAGALALVARQLAPRLGASAAVVLRVVDWQADGVLVHPWPPELAEETDCIDFDALALTRPDEWPLGHALAHLELSYAPIYIDQPARRWRPGQVMQVLVLPVRLGQRAVAALEFHDPVAPGDVARQLLELVGLQLTQAAQREEALRASWVHAEQYGRVAMLASRIGRGAVITDAEGVVEWAHPAFAETTGHSTAEVRGRPLWEVLLRDADDVRPAAMLSERFSSGAGFRVEFMARRGAICLAPSEAYWLEVDAQVMADEATGRLQYVCLCKDISERKERQVDIDEAREILAALTDNLPISLVALDAQSLQVVSLNRHAELEFGAAGDTVAGQDLTQALGPGLAELITPQVREALGRTIPVEHELTWPSVEGERIVAARHVVVRSRHGEARIVISQLRDVTQLRRNEQTLRESEQRYRELVESIEEGVFVTDPSRGACHYLSPRVYDMLGFDDLEDTADGLLMPHVVAEDLPLLQAQKARELRREPSDVTVRIQHRARGLRWVRRRTRTRALPDGELRVYGLFDDVTDERERALQLQAARDTAEAASRAKSQFLATMSHEIRTPMNGILGMTELLLGSSLTDKQRRCAQAVYRSGESLLEIINDVLDFAKIEAGRLELAPTPLDLRTVVEDTLELLAPRAHGKGLELSFQEAAGVPAKVSADPLRLRQVLTNLVGNAIKFTEHGEVVVGLRCLGSVGDEGGLTLEFVVRDTGIGIAAQDLPRLFSAFTQAHGGMARRYGGTGLGLAISRQLVALMGGEIAVTSTPGQGSEFRFTCRAGAAAPDDADDGGLSEFCPLPTLRVLLVEDNPTSRQVLANMLSAWGLQVSMAEDGRAALALLTRSGEDAPSFDLAVVDARMPGMDGLSLARALHGNARTARMKWLLLSAVSAPDDLRQAQEAGYARLLNKPVRKAELREALLGLLAGPAAGESGLPCIDAQILVVEDNLVNQEVMAQMLRRLGCQVQLSGSGLEGLRAMCTRAFDLVLMDIQMPGMDGIEVLTRLRRGPCERFDFVTAADTPVIAVTAHVLDGEGPRLCELGFDGYLPKPLRQGQLLQALCDKLPPERVAGVQARLRDSGWPRLQAGPGVPQQSAAAAAQGLSAVAVQAEAHFGEGFPLLDPAALERLRRLDPSGQNRLVERVIAAFDVSMGRFLPQLAQARAGQDAAGVRHVVHTLKSSAASVGALHLADLCAACDARLRAGSRLDALAADLDGVDTEMQRVQAGVRALMSAGSDPAQLRGA